MITPVQEYEKLLYLIQDKNRPYLILDIPDGENDLTGASTFNINLDTREIEAPKFLSVQYDHNAENIYFKVDRYYDNFDLANTCCVIHYINENPIASQSGYLYVPPFYDLVSFSDEGKMAFQWSIQGPATQYSGDVKFAIRFYMLEEYEVTLPSGDKEIRYRYRYKLNTVPSKSKVLHGMDSQIETDSENYVFPASEIDQIFERISKLENYSSSEIYWLKME